MNRFVMQGWPKTPGRVVSLLGALAATLSSALSAGDASPQGRTLQTLNAARPAVSPKAAATPLVDPTCAANQIVFADSSGPYVQHQVYLG